MLHPASTQASVWISSVHTGYPVSTQRGFLQYLGTAVLQRSTALLHYRALQSAIPVQIYYYYAVLEYNMYHKRPLDAQNAQPIPMPGGGRSERPKAGSRPPQGSWIAGPFWRALHVVSPPRGATTDHSPDASRLRYPGTSNKVH